MSGRKNDYFMEMMNGVKTRANADKGRNNARGKSNPVLEVRTVSDLKKTQPL